jgi:hypothetical protein
MGRPSLSRHPHAAQHTGHVLGTLGLANRRCPTWRSEIWALGCRARHARVTAALGSGGKACCGRPRQLIARHLSPACMVGARSIAVR